MTKGNTFKGNLMISNKQTLTNTTIGSRVPFEFMKEKAPNEPADTRKGVQTHKKPDNDVMKPIFLKYLIST